MANGARPAQELLVRVNTARARFIEAIAVERQLFEKRFDAVAGSFNRWMEQSQKVAEALKDYDAATSAYLAAIAEHWQRE